MGSPQYPGNFPDNGLLPPALRWPEKNSKIYTAQSGKIRPLTPLKLDVYQNG